MHTWHTLATEASSWMERATRNDGDETDAPTAAQLTEQLTRAIAKAEGGQL